MHIPDGYLSIQTSTAMYLASTPFLIHASKKVKETLDAKRVPLISVFAALSFVVMMFNIPLPGGTTGHATGIALSSIVIGPWASILSSSVALLIQALFFGDGGILSLGANIFNMSVAISLVSYFLFKLFTNKTYSRRKKIIFASIASYVGINTAAFFTALELGIQPYLFKNNLGQALYFPYGLNVSMPAMMIGHLTVVGLAEAFVTAGVLSWIYKVQPHLLSIEKEKDGNAGKFIKLAMLGILFLIVFVPLGLLAPGTAWGEWGRDELGSLGLSYIPAGFDKWSSFWQAPFASYRIGNGSGPVAYTLSSLAGVLLIVFMGVVVFFIYKKFRRKRN